MAARWKIENETFNVLKNNGYSLEYNFGHGKETLASVLVTLNLLAFNFHTVARLAVLACRNAVIARGPGPGSLFTTDNNHQKLKRCSFGIAGGLRPHPPRALPLEPAWASRPGPRLIWRVVRGGRHGV